MSSNRISSQLFIRNLEIPVLLGWPDEERKKPQLIQIDIGFRFNNTPKACKTDDLADTFCYDSLITAIKNFLSNHTHKLIESLSEALYTEIQKLLPEDVHICLRVSKQPAIPQLKGGVTFQYGDKFINW